MKLFDALLGRTKPVQANLDALFALPTAAVTLQAAGGFAPTGRAGVCYKPPSGGAFEQLQAEVARLVALGDTPAGDAPPPASVTRQAEDSFGYHWVVLENPSIEDLVTHVHMVNSSLADAGWGPQLLCSVFGIAALGAAADDTALGPATAAGPSTAYLVYLFKRGTFYPFAPTGGQRRDNELELRLRGLIGEDLPMEAELDRWFPLWDLPVA